MSANKLFLPADFEHALQKAFPAYEFEAVKLGCKTATTWPWWRIFVKKRMCLEDEQTGIVKEVAVTLGRISLEPENYGCYRVNSLKHYKPSEYPYAPEDEIFYLFHFWLEHGVPPVINMSQLAREAQRVRQAKIDVLLACRREHPKPNGKGWPRPSIAWMGEFRRLVNEALAQEEARFAKMMEDKA